MSGRILRSSAAVLSGWAVAFVGGLTTMLVIAIRHPESFGTREASLSTGSLLVSLLVSIPWSVIAGFVTGVIARRNEIKHAIGLILFTLVVYTGIGFLNGHKDDTVQAPGWYQTVGYISPVPSVLLGAWLRMRRRTLPQKAPTGVAGAANDLWLSIRILVDQYRLPIAVGLWVVIVLVGTWLGTLMTAIGIRVARRLLGLDSVYPDIDSFCLAGSFLLSFLLGRRVCRKIMTQDSSITKGG